MASLAKNPLSKAEQRVVLDGLRAVHDVLPILEKAALCGYDCQAWADMLEAIRQRLQLVKDHFTS